MPGSYQRFARARAFRDAEDRAAQEIADNIQTRLAAYFYRRDLRSAATAGQDGRVARQGDRRVLLARPDPGRPIILLYGPDAGLVRERADALMASAVDDPNDPFSLVRLDGDELAAEPSRLVDEAMTVPLFGGRRAIRVPRRLPQFASGVETLADTAVRDCRIVIEAGELRAESPLRKACEKAKSAVAIALLSRHRARSREIDRRRNAALQSAVGVRCARGADVVAGRRRQASRNELRKLALYAHGKGEITLEDVMTVVSDASELKLDPVVDAAFAGNAAMVEGEFAKAMVAGTYPGVIIRPRSGRQHGCTNRAGGCRGYAGLGGARGRLSPPAFPRARARSESRCVISARRGWSGSSTSLAMPRSTCASSHPLPRRSRNARCLRSRPMRSGGDNTLTAAEPPHHLVELFEVAVADLPPNRRGSRWLTVTARPSASLTALLQRECVGILFPCRPAPSAACAPARPRHAPAPRPGAR